MGRRVSCSNCHGTKWDETIRSRCPDCQGIGDFPHWKNGQDIDALKMELDSTRVVLEAVKQRLMDYIGGGREEHTRDRQRDEVDRLRWERDYWAFRVQTLQGDIMLLEGLPDG